MSTVLSNITGVSIRKYIPRKRIPRLFIIRKFLTFYKFFFREENFFFRLHIFFTSNWLKFYFQKISEITENFLGSVRATRLKQPLFSAFPKNNRFDPRNFHRFPWSDARIFRLPRNETACNYLRHPATREISLSLSLFFSNADRERGRGEGIAFSRAGRGFIRSVFAQLVASVTLFFSFFTAPPLPCS